MLYKHLLFNAFYQITPTKTQQMTVSAKSVQTKMLIKVRLAFIIIDV